MNPTVTEAARDAVRRSLDCASWVADSDLCEFDLAGSPCSCRVAGVAVLDASLMLIDRHMERANMLVPLERLRAMEVQLFPKLRDDMLGRDIKALVIEAMLRRLH